MNTKLLRRIQKKILAEPKQFQMKDVFETRLPMIKIPNCGTAACIAGWGFAIIKNINPGEVDEKHFRFDNVSINLEITYSQADRLYNFSMWPSQYRKIKREGTLAYAKQASRRIDHFIKTNGAE